MCWCYPTCHNTSTNTNDERFKYFNEKVDRGDYTKKIIAIAVIVSLVMTLVTGLINTTPDNLVGATWYGWPAAWRFVPVTLTPSSNYEVVPFIEDFVFWFAVAFVIMIVWRKFKK